MLTHIVTQKLGIGTPPLVLVVDDYEDNRQMYAEYLEYLGYRVDVAQDGEEALGKATSMMPDVVILDLSLPVMDGWETTRRLKAATRTRQIIVVAVTGHGEREYVDRAWAAGVDDIVLKPCLPADIAAKVSEALTRSGRIRKSGNGNSRPSNGTDKAASRSRR